MNFAVCNVHQWDYYAIISMMCNQYTHPCILIFPQKIGQKSVHYTWQNTVDKKSLLV